MHLPSYRIIENAKDYSLFKFISNGPNGSITKFIIFSELDSEENIYNLALVDVLQHEISDTHLSNNGDLRKVLATVAQILIEYTSKFPERTIFFQGSDNQGKRSSVYHRAISQYYSILEKEFYIHGVISEKVAEKFNPMKKYNGFLVKRK